MGLPWVRLDASIATHDKILRAVHVRGGKAAVAVYMFSLGWSGGHATDGHIPEYALPMIHATKADVAILVDVGLWESDPVDGGWRIRNYIERQELAVVSEVKRASQRLAARRTNCIRWHGKECGCWKGDDDAPPTIPTLSLKRSTSGR